MKRFLPFLLLALMLTPLALSAQAQTIIPRITIGVEQATTPQEVSTSLQIVLLLTVLSIAPSLLILMTSFTRIAVVLGMVRRAVGTQSVPSNQIVIALSLFLTFFIMAPVFKDINDNALQPYLAGELTHEEAFENGANPLRTFMLSQTREKDLGLMVRNANLPRPQTADDLPLYVIVPAFAISELRLAFQMGFLLYLPFIMIDMIIASILMSMGMMMLPPVMISAPFKILLFVLIDGWYIVIETLVGSFG
ncbi:MAG: flagellar type III secretion system pore protein FliP [Candidatus Cloacimonetes bacterium]|nr:flagellar type III secretion system pore protein FliP [Candidatus Cloacimonadota bacterium]